MGPAFDLFASLMKQWEQGYAALRAFRERERATPTSDVPLHVYSLQARAERAI